MSIKTSVASSKRKPGTYHEFDPYSAARGLVPVTNRVLFVAAKTSSGTGTNGVIYQCFVESDADTYWGVGSELALMVRWAFKAAARYGSSPEIFGISIADPAGTAGIRTLTVTGTATAAGDLVVKIDGRVIRAAVANGDAQNTIAAALKAAIDAAQNVEPMGSTASVTTNVVSMTRRNTGVNGNDGRNVVVSAPTGVSVALASSVAGAGAYDITASLDLAVDRYYHAIAVANHTSTDVSDLKAHIDDMGLPQTKKWVFGVLAETAGLSTADTLGTTANYKEVCVINAENFPNTCGEIAAVLATTLMAEEDPALPFDFVELPLFLPADSDVPTDTEIETALAAGTTILSVNDSHTAACIVRFVTTKTSQGSAAFENLLDVSNVKSLFWVAYQVDQRWKIWQQDPRNKKNTEGARDRLRSVTLDTLRQAEQLEILHHVDDHLGQLVCETDAVIPTRLNVGIPDSVVPNLHQLVGVHTLFVEA